MVGRGRWMNLAHLPRKIRFLIVGGMASANVLGAAIGVPVGLKYLWPWVGIGFAVLVGIAVASPFPELEDRGHSFFS
jgi:hypothetical protein